MLPGWFEIYIILNQIVHDYMEIHSIYVIVVPILDREKHQCGIGLFEYSLSMYITNAFSNQHPSLTYVLKSMEYKSLLYILIRKLYGNL